MPVSGSVMVFANSTPPGSGRVKLPNTNASFWKRRPVGLTVPAAPSTVIAALSAGAALTFWYAPEVTIAGLIGRVALPAPSEDVSAVTTNCASEPVEASVNGFTANTPAMVNTSPFFRREAAAAVQPSVTRLAPDCDAPFTSGVPPSGPTV